MKTVRLFLLLLLFLQVARSQDTSATSDVSFPNSPVGDVLTFYEQLSGKRIVRDNNLNTLTVTIVATKPMRVEEAERFVEAGLLLNGVALIPSGPDTIKAVSVAARKPTGEGVPLIYGAEALPAGDAVVTYYMPLEYLKAEEAKKLFETQAPLHDYGVIIEAPGTNALLITESTAVLRRYLELQSLLDREPTAVVNHFVQLTRSDAEKVTDLVMKSLEGDLSSSGSQALAAHASSGTADAGGEVAGVRLIPDKRTNGIMVICPPARFNLVRSLIAQFDSPASVPGAKAFVLHFISAQDILQVLVDALSQVEGISSQGTATASAAAAIPRALPRAPQTSSIPAQGAAISGATGGTEADTDQLEEPEDTAPISVNVGKTWIAADPRANEILISGPPESIDKVRDVIGQLDQKPKQVYLATVIGQLTLGNGTLFGIDYLQRYNGNNNVGVASAFIANSGTVAAASTGTNGIAANILDPVSLVQPSTIVSAVSGLSVYGIVANTVEFYVRALQTTNRFKVLSRPVVYTTNNKKAKIATGQLVPVPVNTLSTAGSTVNTASVQSSIAYQEVLLKLEVIPLINPNGDVTLKIAQTNDSLDGNQTISGNTVPIIATQQLNTTVTVHNGQTIVLGGMVSEQTQVDTTGLPVLSNIPGLGYLFKTTNRTTTRQELLIFIQPVVVDDINTSVAQSGIEEKRSAIHPHFEPVPEEKPPGVLEREINKVLP